MKRKIKNLGIVLLSSLLVATVVSCNNNSNTSSNGSTSGTSIPSNGSTSGTSTPSESHNSKKIYVASKATNGDGSIEHPYDFLRATQVALPGDTIILKEGTYDDYSYRVEINTSGLPGKYITVKPETEDSRVVFDFKNMRFDGTNRGIQIYGDYWHFYGIEEIGRAHV